MLATIDEAHPSRKFGFKTSKKNPTSITPFISSCSLELCVMHVHLDNYIKSNEFYQSDICQVIYYL